MQDVLHLNQARMNTTDLFRDKKLSVTAAALVLPSEVVSTVHVTLRLVSSGACREMAIQLLTLWIKDSRGIIDGDDQATKRREGNVLDSLGAALTKALQERDALGLGSALKSLQLPPPGTVNCSDGLVATARGGREPGSPEGEDEHCAPGGSAPGVTQDRGGAQQCVFASCTAGQDEVIPVVLSIYVRRGRLPQPGELLFCTPNTTNEDLELAVRRFADRRKHHQESTSVDAPSTAALAAPMRDEGVFVIADVHRLTYSSQAVLHGQLRSKVFGPQKGEDGGKGVDGQTGGPVLLVVSGERRQAILTLLSNHLVDLPPLPTDILRKAVASCLERHYEGEGYLRQAWRWTWPYNSAHGLAWLIPGYVFAK